MIRTYSELVKIDSFIDRFKYLELKGKVGYETFGYNRYLNQILYKSEEWREFRRKVLIRDSCCEMGLSSCLLSYIIGRKSDNFTRINLSPPLMARGLVCYNI